MRLLPLLVCTAAVVASCLPADTRPPAGAMHVDAVADERLSNGFDTTDGWSIHYTRFLLSVGRASLEGDSCIAYSDLDYSRVLDMKVASRQKLNLVYGTGACDVDFELSSPSLDSVLGEGVSPADRDFMRTPISDAYAKQSGISIHVEGSATKAGESEHFSWSFLRRIDYSACSVVSNGQTLSGVQLDENADVTIDVTIHGSTLFQDSLDPTLANLGFGDFAAADGVQGNSDGEVTLEELGGVALADIASTNHYSDASKTWKTLEDYVYQGLFAKVVRYRGDGSCELDVFANDRTGH